ncbi:tetratricopeptide repeat protein [Rhabdochlamydiaceae symbiont of Dictyostelium giganteum]|uniref:tetratricopeptide repeat protein n=1 Tax=Rhabdochlamydiaceae symbiont of Dictyostelium giganteum TaxID=3342349 RepID=UPI00384D2362
MTIRPYDCIETLPQSPGYSPNNSKHLKSHCEESPSLTEEASTIQKTHHTSSQSFQDKDIRELNSLHQHTIAAPLKRGYPGAKELLLHITHLYPQKGVFYSQLADLLHPDETVLLFKHAVYTKQALYLKALHLDPHLSEPYFHLANLLNPNESVQLLSGARYAKKELYLKVIDLNPHRGSAYFHLANLFQGLGFIHLLNGKRYTKKELYLKAVGLDPHNASIYYKLNVCHRDSGVNLDGKWLKERDLCLKAIDLDPLLAIAYCNLGALTLKEKSIQLLNGESYTKKELYMKAIDLDAQMSLAYLNLGLCLDKGEIIKFLNGEWYTKKKLYLKALDLNPNDNRIYNYLGDLLHENEIVRLLNGKCYTKKEVCLKALQLYFYKSCVFEPGISEAKKYLKATSIQEIADHPHHIESYLNLIFVTRAYSISLQDQSLVTTESLFQTALDRDPTLAFHPKFAPVFFYVGSLLYHKTRTLLDRLDHKLNIQELAIRENLLKHGYTLLLKNGTVLSTQMLYRHALPFLTSSYLKLMRGKGIGDQLSYREVIVLQDGIHLTKALAYTYAYQETRSFDERADFFMRLGDALHPEQWVILGDSVYDKKKCYEECHERGVRRSTNGAIDLRVSESLPFCDHLQKNQLFCRVLDYFSSHSTDHWSAHITLARILSQWEIKEWGYPYILMFGGCLESYQGLHTELFNQPLNKYHGSLGHVLDLEQVTVDQTLYDAKKQQFLISLLTFLPSCEEAYLALGRDFKTPLTIHEICYSSPDSLYLKALDINMESSLAYFLLGKSLFMNNIKSTHLLNGVTLSYKQLLMRAVQLGTYEAEAYHFAAVSMHDRESILLFDGKTLLSREYLFIRAFDLDPSRVTDLKNFILCLKRKALSANKK